MWLDVVHHAYDPLQYVHNGHTLSSSDAMLLSVTHATMPYRRVGRFHVDPLAVPTCRVLPCAPHGLFFNFPYRCGGHRTLPWQSHYRGRQKRETKQNVNRILLYVTNKCQDMGISAFCADVHLLSVGWGISKSLCWGALSVVSYRRYPSFQCYQTVVLSSVFPFLPPPHIVLYYFNGKW